MTWGGQFDDAYQARHRRREVMGFKPAGQVWSNYIAGRMKSFRRLEKGKAVVVSAYLYNGVMRYSDPVKQRTYGQSADKPGPGVLYRIRVKPKEAMA